MDDAHGFHCSDMQLEQCQMVVCKFIAAVLYMHVLRQLRRGFCTIVLHYSVLYHCDHLQHLSYITSLYSLCTLLSKFCSISSH